MLPEMARSSLVFSSSMGANRPGHGSVAVVRHASREQQTVHQHQQVSRLTVPTVALLAAKLLDHAGSPPPSLHL